MATNYGVTDKGFVLKRFDTILSEVQSEVSDALGFDVSQNPQSMLNSALLVPFCDKIAALWEELQNSYYAKYPATAEGVNLDNACQYGNIFRAGNKPSEYIIHVTATDGTAIPKGSLISSATNPVVQLKCVQDTTVERAACNAIAVKTVGAISGTYSFVLNGDTYSVTVGEDGVEPTSESVLTKLGNRISASGYTCAMGEDNAFLLVEDTVLSRHNVVQLSSNLTTEYVVSCVHYYTVDYGDIQLPNDSIIVITSNITGLISVTNKLAPTPGRLQQDDVSFRQDYISKSYTNSSTQTQSVESYILDEVPGVVAVRCYENVSMEIVDGMPPKSISVICDGGDNEAIARAILDKKAGGIETAGDVSVNVLGEYGDQIIVKFSRPEPVLVWVQVELTEGSRSVDPDYEDIVKGIILASDLTIGDSFMSQSYIDDIYAALPGIMYCKISVGTGSTEPAEYEEGNVIVTQKQKVSLDGARIEVTIAS